MLWMDIRHQYCTCVSIRHSTRRDRVSSPPPPPHHQQPLPVQQQQQPPLRPPQQLWPPVLICSMVATSAALLPTCPTCCRWQHQHQQRCHRRHCSRRQAHGLELSIIWTMSAPVLCKSFHSDCRRCCATPRVAISLALRWRCQLISRSASLRK